MHHQEGGSKNLEETARSSCKIPKRQLDPDIVRRWQHGILGAVVDHSRTTWDLLERMGVLFEHNPTKELGVKS